MADRWNLASIPLVRFISVLTAEVFLPIKLFKPRARSTQVWPLTGPQARPGRQQTAEQRIIISGMLQRTPFWARGHLLLGLTQLKLLEFELDREGQSRRTAAVQMSGEAALKLLNLSGCVIGCRKKLVAQANFLIAAADFYKQSYEVAINQLSVLLRPDEIDNLRETIRFSAAELAGIAALTIGRNAEAKNFFLLIPAKHRSAEVVHGLGLLDASSSR